MASKTLKLSPRALDILLESATRIERDRTYLIVQHLREATLDRTSHGKAQRVAYRRVMEAIYPGGKVVDSVSASDLSGQSFSMIVNGFSPVSGPGMGPWPGYNQPGVRERGGNADG